MKITIHKTLPDGRVVGEHRRPLHVRMDLESGRLAKVTLGVEQREGEVSWQLSVSPTALSWAASCVEEALLTAAQAANAQANAVDRERGNP